MFANRAGRVVWLRRAALAAVALALLVVPWGERSSLLGSNSADAARQVSAAATLPAGFQDTIAISGLAFPTAVRFASDGRVFVAEKSGLLKVFDSLTDTTPTRVRRLQHRGRRLLGPRPARHRARPELPGQPVRLRALRLRRAARRQTAPRLERRLPDAARARTPTAASSRAAGPPDDVRRRGHDHDDADLDRLVPAVPEPLGRRPALRAGRRPVRQRRRRRELHVVDYGQDGGSAGSPTAKNPCGDPPAGAGGTRPRRPPRAARCAAQSMRRPTGEPVLAQRRAPAGRPGDRRRRCRATRASSSTTRTRADRRLRLPQPVPVHVPPGHRTRSGSATSAQDTLGGDRPHRSTRWQHGRQLRLALLRGQRPAVPATRRRPRACCTSLYATPTGAADAVLHLQPRRPGRARTTSARSGSSSISGIAFYQPAAPTRRRTTARLFFARPLAQLHLGDDAGRERPARPDEQSRRSSVGRVEPGRPRDRPERRPLLRRLRRRHDPPRHLPERHVLDRQLPRRLLQQQDPRGIAGAQPLRDRHRLLMGRGQPRSVDHRRQLLGPMDRQLHVRGRHVQVHASTERRCPASGSTAPR